MQKRSPLKSRFLLKAGKQLLDQPEITNEAVKRYKQKIDEAKQNQYASEVDLTRAVLIFRKAKELAKICEQKKKEKAESTTQ